MATDVELLADAERAYHSLMIGESARVVVDQNGERVEYTAANAPRLQAYITVLRNRISDAALQYRPRGPVGAFF